MEVEEDIKEINIVEEILKKKEYQEALNLIRKKRPESFEKRLTELKNNGTQNKTNVNAFSAQQEEDNENDNNENNEKQKKGKKEKKKKKGKNTDDEDKPKRKNKRNKVE